MKKKNYLILFEFYLFEFNLTIIYIAKQLVDVSYPDEILTSDINMTKTNENGTNVNICDVC
jgi:hypothetical protein